MDQPTPCLLFVADRNEPQSRKRTRLARSTIKGFALLPEAFMLQNPQVFDIFLYNGIHVLSKGQSDFVPLTAQQAHTFEVFELFVRPERPCTESVFSDTIIPLVVYVDAHNKTAVKLTLERNVSVITTPANEKIIFADKIDEDGLKVIKNILTFTTDIGYGHRKCGTILHFAVKRGQDALVKLLLQNGMNANVERRQDGMTPLHLAAKKGQLEIANCLLQHEANVDARASGGEFEDATPLVVAIKNQHLEVAAVLVVFGADINVVYNSATFILKSVFKKDGAEIVKFLTFLETLDKDHLSVIQNILAFGQNVGYQHLKGETILLSAVKKGQVPLVKLLLRYGVNSCTKCPDGMTPLHFAAKKGFVEIAECLLHHGANVSGRADYKNLTDVTPLVFALKNRHLKVSGLLIEYGADINVEFNDGSTILELVTQDSADVTVERRKLEAKLNIKLGANWTYLTVFSEKSPDPNVLDFILNNHPSVNSERNRRAFCLVLSFCADAYKTVFKKMSDYGFTVDYDNIEDPFALLFGAVHKNLFETVQILVRQVLNINELYHPKFYDGRKLTLLHMAAGHASENIIKLLLKHGANVNASCHIGRDPLDDAIKAGNLNAVKLLIENGAEVHYSMCYAPSRCDPELIKVLFLAGADLNLGFEDQDSPLSKAAFKGDMKIIKLLIHFGVRIGSGEVSPTFVLREALRGCKQNVFQFLLDYFFTDMVLIGHLRNICSSGIRTWYHSYGDAIARYLIKLESTGLKFSDEDFKFKVTYGGSNLSEDLKSTWHFDGENPGDFWRRCNAEIAVMKREKIGSTNIAFFNVLIGNINRLTGYARNEIFVETMKAYDYEDRFPIYARIINYQFQKGFKRATLVKLNSKILESFIPKFRSLPQTVKEEVLSYCSDRDLLITAMKMPTNSKIFHDNPHFLEFLSLE